MKVILVTTLFFLSAAIATAQSNDSTGVIKTIEGFRTAFAKKDARILADLFATDADFTNVIDSTVHGRENIYQHHINVFKNSPSTRKINVLSYHIRFIAPGIAVAEIRWINIHSMAPDGTTMPNRDGVWITTMTKENGNWYFKIVRNVFLHDGSPGHEVK